MEEERLIHLLRGLPREMAPGGFTTQVLRRLDAQPGQAAGPARLARPAGHARSAGPVRPARQASDRPSRWPAAQGWHRLMMATATVAALGVSVGVSVAVLQRDRPALPLAAGVPGTPLPTMTPAREVAAASPMDRTFRHEGAGDAELALPAVASGRRGAVEPRGAAAAGGGLDAARAHQLLRELQLERGRLERELHSLHRPGPSVLYLGGNESFDLVLSIGRNRAQVPPAGERDDGENYDYL
jgi:hypothetical protein